MNILSFLRKSQKEILCPKKAKQSGEVNAIMEGIFQDDTSNYTYKISRLDIPENATILNSGSYKYVLFGRTDDFHESSRVYQPEKQLEVKIDNLSFCKGIVMPCGGFPYIVQKVLSLCTKDGRLFVEQNLVERNDSYVHSLGGFMQQAGKIFNNQENLKMLSNMYSELK